MVTDLEVRKIAKLIHVKINDDELPWLAQQLSKILDFVEILSEVNCDAMELDLGGTIYTMHERDDQIDDNQPTELLLTNAPSKKYNMFSVPKIIE